MANRLKNLPPEEKIRRLKELQKKKKQELAEAEKDIKESEEELSDQQKFLEKVPIPEVAKEDLVGLSEAAREIMKLQRGLRGKKAENEEEGTERNDEDSSESLEDAIHNSIPRLGSNVNYELPQADPLLQMNVDYVMQLSQKPVEEIRRDVEYISKQVAEKGYVNPEEQRSLQYHAAAIEEKIKAGEGGNYANWSEEVAQTALLTRQVTGRLLDQVYHSANAHDVYFSKKS